MFRKLMCLGMSLAAATLFADVTIRTNIRDVAVGAPGQQTGAISFSLDNDDFSQASPDTPLYLRLQFSHAAVLDATLVDYQASLGEEHVNEPIYLPLRLDGGLPADGIAAPADAVSIVRFIASESTFWIKIQRSSSTWVFNSSSGQETPPDPTRPVSFIIGTSARVSDVNNRDAYDAGDASLPGARRDLDQLDPGFTLSTLICVDLTNATLEPIPQPEPESVLTLDPLVFDHTTEGVTTSPTEQGVTPGAAVPVAFGNDRRVGRGQPSVDNGVFYGDNPPAVQPLCDPQHQLSDNPNLISLTALHRLTLEGGAGIEIGSSLTFTNAVSNAYGYRVAVDGEGQPVLSRTVDALDYYLVEGVGLYDGDQTELTFDTPETHLFQLHGTTLTNSFTAVIQEPDTFQLRLNFFMEIFTDINNPTLTPTAQYSAFLNGASPFDTAPFDGTGDDGDPNTGVTAADQAVGCMRASEELEGETIELGNFVETCPRQAPTSHDWNALLPSLNPDQLVEVTLTRDHPVTQHLTAQYMGPDGSILYRILVLDGPTLHFSVSQIQWFTAAGEPADFPGFGGRLRIFNLDDVPFLVTARLLPPIGFMPIPFDSAALSGTYHFRLPAASEGEQNILYLYRSGQDGPVSMTRIDADGMTWIAQTDSIPAGLVTEVNLATLDWTPEIEEASFGSPGGTPSLLSVHPEDDQFSARLMVTQNEEIYFIPSLTTTFFETEKHFPILGPMADGPRSADIHLMRDPSVPVVGNQTAVLHFWENPNFHWLAEVPLDQPFKTFQFEQRKGVFAVYDAQTQMRYDLIPAAGNTGVFFRGLATTEVSVTSTTPIHAELETDAEGYEGRHYPRSTPDLNTLRVSYRPSEDRSHELLVNSFLEEHTQHHLYIHETDGDVFQISLLNPNDNLQPGDHLDVVRLSAKGVTITRDETDIALEPTQLAGDGVFYDAPATVESTDGAALTLVTRDVLQRPNFTPAGAVNTAVLSFESKPLIGAEQVHVTSAVPQFPFALLQQEAFEPQDTIFGTTDENGAATVSQDVFAAQFFSLQLWETNGGDEAVSAVDALTLGFLDVGLGPNLILDGGEVELSAQVGTAAFDPEDFDWLWSNKGVPGGEQSTLSTARPGRYTVTMRHRQQRFKASDSVWLLVDHPDGVTAPYIPPGTAP